MLDDIRAEIWLKLWGNLTFNPISSLTHSTLVDICQYPPSRELAAAMMREAQAVAHKLGIEFRVSLEKRIAGAEKVGKHKTSMLQDVEAGRAPEIDALVGAVVELARLTDTPTPHIDTVYALVKLLARTMEDQRRAGPSARDGLKARPCDAPAAPRSSPRSAPPAPTRRPSARCSTRGATCSGSTSATARQPTTHGALRHDPRASRSEVGRPIGVLLDLQGPSCASARSPAARSQLEPGDASASTSTRRPATRSACRLPHPEIFAALQAGTDAAARRRQAAPARASAAAPDFAETRVVVGGAAVRPQGRQRARAWCCRSRR